MRESGRRRRVRDVVGRYVNGLHRRDRARTRGSDALLQIAHLRRERRLITHGARHTAEERDSSAPACIGRKMVVNNTNTSAFSWSRKYSATVRPERPTRRRAPGGSFICP